MIDVLQLSAIVYSLVEVLKMAGLPSKFSSLLAVIMGVGFSFLFVLPISDGIIAGLTASGLYAGTKATFK